MQKNELAKLALYMGVKLENEYKNSFVEKFSVDTRTLNPGDIFFALPGARTNGAEFIIEAVQKGAKAIVSTKKIDINVPQIIVQDPLEALQRLAKETQAHRKAKIVGVTGSIGKTSTKTFIATLLGERYKVHASPGNSNSKIGLPLSILNELQDDDEIAILEMGMTHPGQIKALIDIAPPDVAVVTTVDLVHACNFDSLKEIAAAKGEILTHPKTRLGIINYDIEHFNELIFTGSCHKKTFSIRRQEADEFGVLVGNKFNIRKKNDSFLTIPYSFLGSHMAQNILGAYLVAKAYGLSDAEVIEGAKKLQLPERRLQQIEKNGVLFINDSYNAGPTSLKAVLRALPSIKGKKKIAVIGNMTELGKYTEESHRQVGETALQCVNEVLCLGVNCQPIIDCFKEKGLPCSLFIDRKELVDVLKTKMNAGDVVLLKGSKPCELWKVLEEID